MMFGLPALASTTLTESSSEKLFALPVEMDFDFGAENGNAIIARLIPVHSIPLQDDWRLLNTGILVLANAPGGVPGTPGKRKTQPHGCVTSSVPPSAPGRGRR